MKIEIDEQEYNMLRNRSEFLRCLQACGLKYWSGTVEAMLMFNEIPNHKEIINAN